MEKLGIRFRESRELDFGFRDQVSGFEKNMKTCALGERGAERRAEHPLCFTEMCIDSETGSYSRLKL